MFNSSNNHSINFQIALAFIEYLRLLSSFLNDEKYLQKLFYFLCFVMMDIGSETDAEVMLVQGASSSGPSKSVVDEWPAFK